MSPLDWGILATALLALIFSFFSYYSYSLKGAARKETCGRLSQLPSALRGQAQDVCDGVGNSAWHGFFGWFGVLLAVIAAILVAVALFAPTVKLPLPVRLAALGLFGLALISTLLALLVVPDGEYNGQTIPSDSKTVDAGHGFSYWIVLILIIIGTVLAALRFRQSGEQLPSRGGSGALGRGDSAALGGGEGASSGYGQPSSPGDVTATQARQGPPPGYGQQPPQGPPQGPPGPPPGFGQQPPQGPPQGPPPGYGQQPPQGPPPGYGQQPPQGPPQGPPPGYGQQPPQGPPQGPPPGYGQQPPQGPPQGPPPAYTPPPGYTPPPQ